MKILVGDEYLLRPAAVLGDAGRQLSFLEPFADVLSYHSRNHQRPAHAYRFYEGRAHGNGLEDTILSGKAAGHSDIWHLLPPTG